jgi:soluble lytic murein transglycosylase
MTGKTAEAQQTYSQCVAQKSWNYYGLISEARLREQGVAVDGTLLRPRETPTPTPPVLNAEWAQTDAGGPQLDVGAKKSIDYYATQGPAAVRPVFQSLRELRDLNLTDEISDRLDFVKDQVQATADGSYFLSVGYALAGDNWSSIIAAVRGLPHVQQGRLRDPQGLLVRRVYPTLYSDMVRQAGRRYDLDYLFLLAIIKQESAFNVNDRSWAGAIGLIQVMPGTARYIARKRGLRRFQPATLYRPEVSLDYGCYELADLMKKTNGDLAAVLAGYNAGYGRPRQWWPLHTERSYDEMIELIPITETRDYVKIIFANYEMYQRLYRDDPTHAANRPSELKKLFGRVRPLGS